MESMNYFTVFAGCIDADAIKNRFKELAKKFHPDRGGSAEEFELLVKSRDAALSDASAGKWYAGKIRAGDGLLVPLASRPFENGTEYYTDSGVVFDFRTPTDAERVDRILNGLAAVSDSKLRRGVMYSFPERHKKLGRAVSIGRERVEAPLDAFVEAGSIPHEHVAWMVSSLLNACCYMETQRVVHGALTPKNVLVNAKKHYVRIVGGWEFHAPRGATIDRVPGWVYNHVQKSCFADKKANHKTDLESVKALARAVTGPGAPRAVSRWMELPCGESAAAEYKGWTRVRDSSYEKKFIAWDSLPTATEKYTNGLHKTHRQ